MSAERPVCVLVAAVGGQGGGVLGDWLSGAARVAGYPAQVTSIPGVAQRTGATTYYFELYPEREPPAPPVFTLFPDPGDVDLMAALEPTEAARALSRGFVTAGTTVITATERLYSTEEKMVAGDGRTDLGALLGDLRDSAARLIQFRGEAGESLNAVLLGAIAGSGVLPVAAEHFRAAIEDKGIALESNLAGFERGLELARGQAAETPGDPEPRYQPVPAELAATLRDVPEPLQPLAGHALARLADYQDAGYARLYLQRLARVTALEDARPDHGWRLSEIVARRLAAWMSYEDVMRVAQLKTRPGRLARIRAEAGAAPGEPVEVVEFLKPGREELLALVPAALQWLLPRGRRLEAGIPVRLRSSSPTGYGALRALAWMRRLRRRSPVFAREQRALEAWLEAVVAAAGKDYELACATAELAVWVRGYGRVRQRGHAVLATLLQDWPSRLESAPEVLAAEVRASLETARRDPEAAGCSAPARAA